MNQIVAKIDRLSELKKAFFLSLVLGVSSIVSFKIPFMPVPWVIQNQLCLMIGFIFGQRIGLLSSLFFLIEGVLGAPIFSLGRSGVGMILGTSGGYLLAYPLGSFMAGYLKQKLPQKALFIFINLFASNLIIYGFGLLQLALFVGVKKACLLGFVPFIALDVIKTIVASFVLSFRKASL
jgi:biotin transport system substrate-specific component